jgi:glutamyl-tRNA synthetase
MTALRFNRSSLGFEVSDPVILRKDGIPAYHIGSICDDVDFGVTHIFRGSDLKESTLLQSEIALAAGMAAFGEIEFQHHPLILDPQGQKLSKSVGNAVDKSSDTLIQDFAVWMGNSLRKATPQNLSDLLDLPLSII